MLLPLGEWCRTLMMISGHWFRQWLGAASSVSPYDATSRWWVHICQIKIFIQMVATKFIQSVKVSFSLRIISDMAVIERKCKRYYFYNKDISNAHLNYFLKPLIYDISVTNSQLCINIYPNGSGTARGYPVPLFRPACLFDHKDYTCGVILHVRLVWGKL